MTTSSPKTTTAATIPTSLTAQLDLHIALALWSWPALTFAIHSFNPTLLSSKREWLAGAISELLTSSPAQLHEVADLEEVLLQVMNDEFEVVVDDGSAEETAVAIWRGCELLQRGETAELEERYRRFVEKEEKKAGGKGEVEALKGFVRGQDEEGEETDWEEDDEEFNGFDDPIDVEMGDAPTPAQKKEKPVAEVDEDGFTMVTGKKKR
jgi:pre-rRNA-processing protein TSR2